MEFELKVRKIKIDKILYSSLFLLQRDFNLFLVVFKLIY